MRNSFGRPTGISARVRAGAIIAEVGTYLKHLPSVRDRLRIASMKISCSAQVVVLKYKSPEILKKSGLILYDDKKRREISFIESAVA